MVTSGGFASVEGLVASGLCGFESRPRHHDTLFQTCSDARFRGALAWWRLNVARLRGVAVLHG